MPRFMSGDEELRAERRRTEVVEIAVSTKTVDKPVGMS
jgi:hypothetical protein